MPCRGMFNILFLCFFLCPHGHGDMPGDETSGLSKMLREMFGGSKARNFFHKFVPGMRPLPNRHVGTAVSQVETVGSGLKEQTFVTMPLTLMNGRIANKWLPLDWPDGHVAVKAFSAEVVKSGPNGEAPPATPCCGGPHATSSNEVFLHHWTVNKWQLPAAVFEWMVGIGGLEYDLNGKINGIIEFLGGAGLNAGANGPCMDSNLHVFFGIGNEVRSKKPDGSDAYSFPDPYGIEFDSDFMKSAGQFMVLNTHLIDTRNVSNRRACEECKCKELGTRSYYPDVEGGLNCCHSTEHDGGKCPLVAGTQESNVTYYIRYTMKFRDFDQTIKPLEVITFDATDNNSKWADFAVVPGGFPENHTVLKESNSMAIVLDARSGDYQRLRSCHIEYFVPSCAVGEPCVQRVRNSWTLPWSMQVVYVRNHFHAGGVRMMSKVAGSFECIGNATYKNDSLVDISTCSVEDGTLTATDIVPRGSTMEVDATYKQDDLPHYGVMAMSFIYAYIPSKQDFLV